MRGSRRCYNVVNDHHIIPGDFIVMLPGPLHIDKGVIQCLKHAGVIVPIGFTGNGTIRIWGKGPSFDAFMGYWTERLKYHAIVTA